MKSGSSTTKILVILLCISVGYLLIVMMCHVSQKFDEDRKRQLDVIESVISAKISSAYTKGVIAGAIAYQTINRIDTNQPIVVELDKLLNITSTLDTNIFDIKHIEQP